MTTTMTKRLAVKALLERVNIKAILADPILRRELLDATADFICHIEQIGRHAKQPPSSNEDRKVH